MDTVEYINGFAFGYSVSAKAVPDSEYHCKNDYEIMYVKNGKRQAFVKDKSYVLTDGQLLLIDKNELHKTSHISDKYERFVINFNESYILPSIRRKLNILFEQRIFAPDNTASVEKIFFRIFSEWENLRKNDNMAADNIKCYINILLAYLIRNHDKFACIGTKIDNPSIERLLIYMNDHFMEHISLSDAADMLHLSPPYLSKIFLKYTGFGFSEYLKTLRVETAKKLLSTTTMSVTKISDECGFSDSNYFSVVFKEQTGFSPLRYRKMNSV